VELSWGKLLGVVLMLALVPARLKEWAYAGFAITLASALIAHLSMGDGPERVAGRWPPACSGGSRTSSGAACRPRRRDLRRRSAFNMIPIIPIKSARWLPPSSELLSHQKRLPLAEIASYAERS